MNYLLWFIVTVFILMTMCKGFQWVLKGNEKSSYSDETWDRIHKALMDVGEKNR